jgi:hypothetical protein
MKVDGNIGDVFYCPTPGHAGWYKVDGIRHAVKITENDARNLHVDIKHPPSLKNYQEYTLIHSNTVYGTDLNAFAKWLQGNGNYINAKELKELAEKGTFHGNKVNDPAVLATAKSLHWNNDTLFNRIDSGGKGNGDGIIAPWDITAMLRGK